MIESTVVAASHVGALIQLLVVFVTRRAHLGLPQRAHAVLQRTRIIHPAAFSETFRHVETLFVQGRNLVPSRPGIGWRKVNKPF